jgi:hypothetical protein
MEAVGINWGYLIVQLAFMGVLLGISGGLIYLIIRCSHKND